jgi:uncharacterized protein YkwD
MAHMLPTLAFSIALFSSADRADDARALWADLNATRRSAGLRTLVLEPRLCRIAQAHAADMVARRYFAHVSPDGVGPFERLTRAGWRYGYAGENLALDVSEEQAERHLLASTPHRENMLEPHYLRVGIAVVATDSREVFVEIFSD